MSPIRHSILRKSMSNDAKENASYDGGCNLLKNCNLWSLHGVSKNTVADLTPFARREARGSIPLLHQSSFALVSRSQRNSLWRSMQLSPPRPFVSGSMRGKVRLIQNFVTWL